MWHLVDGALVDSDSSSVFFQTSPGSGVTPSASTLLRSVAGSVSTPDHNGLWTCQMSGVGGAVPVGLYRRGGGKITRQAV